jgi:L-malate glycosyltransferase
MLNVPAHRMSASLPCRIGGDAAPTPVFLMTNTLEVGGSERQFCILAEMLDRRDFDVRLGCMRRCGPLQTRVADIREFLPVGNFFTLKALRAGWVLACHLRTQKIAVAHAFDFYSNLMLLPTARLARIPVIIGSHRQLGDLLTPRQFTAQMVAFRMCDRVVCNSHAAASRLVTAGLQSSKIALISNAIPDRMFAPCDPVLPKNHNLLRVGLIGRMNNPVKNHALFLRSAVRVIARCNQVEFLMAGDGYLRPDLQNLVRTMALGDRVKFLGERDDIPAVLATMDVSVVASSSESLSNVILESMAAGVPVVATNVGGNAELVQDGETGILVSPNDEQCLAEAIQKLLLRPELRRQYAVRAQSWVRDHFGSDKIRRQYERLYEDQLAAKGKTPFRPDRGASCVFG